MVSVLKFCLCGVNINAEAVMRIGIITAMAEETLPVYQNYGKIEDEGFIAGAKVYHISDGENQIYLANSGVGQLRAGMTAQMLVDVFEVEAILNFGLVASINPSFKIGDLVIVGAAVHYQIDLSAIDNLPPGHYDNRNEMFFRCDSSIINRVQEALPYPLPVVIDASGDKFVAATSEKIRLRECFGVDICEMEAAAIAFACERNGIPFFSLKVISDCADEATPENFTSLKKRKVGYETLLPTIIRAVTEKKEIPLPPSKI